MAVEERLPISKPLRLEGRVVGHELVHIAHERIARLIERSRLARTLEDHVELQKELAREVWRARDLDQQIKERKEQLRRELQARKQAGDSAGLALIGPMLRGFDAALAANRRARYAMRVVQDGIIWRALGFNRLIVSVLGTGTAVGYPSASFDDECAAAEQHWNNGRLALLGDLSNCIRTGDLLVVEGRREITVAEVKESPRAVNKPTRQSEFARVKIEYLNSGRSEELTQLPLTTAARRPRLKTHLSVLRDLFARARRSQGWVFGRAGEALAVSVVDGAGIPPSGPDGERLRRCRAAFEAQLGWREEDVYSFDSTGRIQRDAKDGPASIAPFSIFPFPAETCAALAVGFSAYRTVLNRAVLKASLERRGLAVDIPPLKDQSHTFLRIRRGDESLLVRPAHGEMLLIELVSVGAFGQFLDAAMDAGADETASEYHVAAQWGREEQVWW